MVVRRPTRRRERFPLVTPGPRERFWSDRRLRSLFLQFCRSRICAVVGVDDQFDSVSAPAGRCFRSDNVAAPSDRGQIDRKGLAVPSRKGRVRLLVTLVPAYRKIADQCRYPGLDTTSPCVLKLPQPIKCPLAHRNMLGPVCGGPLDFPGSPGGVT